VEDLAVIGDGRLRVVEGMEELPTRLAQRLRDGDPRADIRLNCTVTRIVVDSLAKQVHVFSRDDEILPSGQGGDENQGFGYVVCAIPAAAACRIHFVPALPVDQVEALTGINYMSASKTLVLLRQRRWEKPDADQIYGGASYTDLPIQEVWYPSDNAAPIDPNADPNADPDTQVLRATSTSFVGPRPGWSTSPTLYGPNQDVYGNDGWKRPTILTAAYMKGINAERFSSLRRKRSRTDLVLDSLSQLHHGIRDDVVDVRHCCWIEQTTPGGGAWAFFPPGSHERYQDLLCQPHPQQPGPERVFFAGEHLCVLHGWMQSAVQSALAATMAIMDHPYRTPS
jgi:monoamine oxidase